MASSESLRQYIDSHLPFGEVTTRKMFGAAVYFVRGKMFLFLQGEDAVLKLAPEDYEEALAQAGVRPFIHTFSTFGTWARFPMATQEQRAFALSWVDRAYEYVKASPALEREQHPKRRPRPRMI